MFKLERNDKNGETVPLNITTFYELKLKTTV